MLKILSSIFPDRCIRCSQIDNTLCAKCKTTLQITRGPDLSGIEQCWSAGPYSGWLREAVLAYKSGRIEYVDGLADVLYRVIKATNYAPLSIVNIPSTSEKVRSRGFDTIGELALALAERSQQQVLPALKFARKIHDQVGLDRHERAENLASAFTSSQAIFGSVTLIDDVVTTGSTVIAAAKCLRLCGVKKIYVISLCRT